MFRIDKRISHLAAGALLAVFTCLPALADDAEIYQSQAEDVAQPNVLFVIDTSGSMNTDVTLTPAPFDPTKTYDSQGCDTDRIYFSRGTDAPGKCSDGNSVSRDLFVCDAAAVALVNAGGSGTWPAFGLENAIAAQYRPHNDETNDTWGRIRGDRAGYVECMADEGVHGQSSGSSLKFIANGDDGPWTSATKNLWDTLTSQTYRFFTANYMNWLNGPRTSAGLTRLEVVRDVAINLASSLTDVNLGLMRYSSDAQGGYVLEPVADIATNRATIIDKLDDFGAGSGGGNTPLTETLYEASLYLQGLAPDYGTRPGTGPAKSEADSISNGKYISPIQHTCQKNYIVYLTDGAPTSDDDANGKIETMIGKACANQTEPVHDDAWTPGSGICMDELAAWMADDQNTDLNPNVDQNQNAQTYMIGFGDSIAGSKAYLDAIAAAGGTNNAYTAGDVPTLTAALRSIFSDLQQDSGTFVTPSISVNAFNRAQTDNDLFFSLFKVGKRQHWDGNLKKYALDTTKGVVDATGALAVNANGLFADGTRSFWSSTNDGGDITVGGAASRQPAPDSRTLVTSVAGNDLLNTPNNAITTDKMTDALVGTGDATTGCSTACQQAINWVRGKDVDDADRDNDRDELNKKFMGDPIHGSPAVVTYGKTTDTPPASNTIVYVPTNDGFLHAIRGVSGTAGGQELWAYSPPEVLTRLGALRQIGAGSHSYGLDGEVRILKTDKNRNGVVDGDDVVYLFFGMRAGGNRYYALNVTDPLKPLLLWNIGPDELPGVGQTWSPPVVARVHVGGDTGNTDDPDKFVLIFGGGYDTAQETQTYAVDTVGNRIFMVDAVSGALLWSAGGPDSGATLVLDKSGKEMNNSIPGRINVIDTNADGLADRLYAGDMGGRIWRFDITNGNEPATLVAGGIIAKLGAGGISPAPAETENRRFYNAPDVTLIQLRGIDPFYNIAIGSGYRGHPLDKVTHERFYSIRDKAPFASLTQDQYDGIDPITDATTDLIDITSDPTGTAVDADKVGWKLSMNMGWTSASAWNGEKVLSEATTVANAILFTTFQPTSLSGAGPCFPTTLNRVYALSAFAGKPVINYFEASGDTPNLLNNKDLFVDLKQQGIVGDVSVALVRGQNGAGAPQTVCLAGMELLKKCVNVGGTVRTFWNRADAK